MIKVLSMEASLALASNNMKASQPDKNMVTVFCGGGGGGGGSC